MNTLKSILLLIILLYSNLSVASFDRNEDYKLPDEIGNLFKTKEQNDRQYGKAGHLLKDAHTEGARSEKYTYSCEEVGNLIEKESITDKWRYKWSQSGMLQKVIRADKKHVDFSYDALGRRLSKTYEEETTRFVWDGMGTFF